MVGFHAVVAALEHQPSRVERVLIADGTVGGRARRVIDLARAAGARYQTSPRRQLDEVAGSLAHNGFAARVAPVPFVDADEMLERPAPVCLLGLDGIEDGRNLGAVIRVADAFGLGGVVVGGPHPPPLGGAAAKVAAGSLPRVPVGHVGALGDFAGRAKRAGFWVLGAAARGTAVSRRELPDRLLLCLGAEAGGLRSKTRSALDGVVGIPIAEGVESLNLAVAAGILAWEWRKHFPAG